MKRLFLSAVLLAGVLSAGCGDDEPCEGANCIDPTTSSTTSSSSAGGASSSSASVGGGGSGGGGVGGAGGGIPQGIGLLSGMCGELDPAELMTGSAAFIVQNEIDFGMMAMMTPDPNDLPPDTKKVHDDGNLGGSSLWSEVFSFDVLRRCELATLLKTEAEIAYTDPMGKKTDLLVEIDGATIGVSVTRAYHFPPTDPYTVAEAQMLLEDKLSDIQLSTANVSASDQWQKQILHVLAYEPQYVMSLATAWQMIDANTKADSIVIVTLTSGDDAFIY